MHHYPQKMFETISEKLKPVKVGTVSLLTSFDPKTASFNLCSLFAIKVHAGVKLHSNRQ